MFDIDYKQKYLKYKNKYLSLKSVIGGSNDKDSDMFFISNTNHITIFS